MSTRAKPFRLGLYRHFLKALTPWLDQRRPHESLGFNRVDKTQVSTQIKRRGYYWIHAASAGELECLEPLALALASKDIPLAVTVFSPSAKVGFLKLRNRIQQYEGIWLGGGLSPFEGSWGDFFRDLPPPKYFITAKYEAWPELWASAVEFNFPILIVGAQARSSLKWASRVLKVLLGLKLPRLLLAAFNRSHLDSLVALKWSDNRTVQVRDPRWDTIFRPGTTSERASALMDWAARCELPRPWGMIGNSWMSDFTQIPSILQNERFARTLWVIPHEVSGSDFEAQFRLFRSQGLEVVRTSELDFKTSKVPQLQGRICILVDEIGVLKHLYQSADFAFVGGGFGRGLHNVMEPAAGGALVFAGPVGADRFAEVEELVNRGQLSILRSEADFTNKAHLLTGDQYTLAARTKRREELTQLSGGTSDVLSALFGA